MWENADVSIWVRQKGNLTGSFDEMPGSKEFDRYKICVLRQFGTIENAVSIRK
jgi:hypothetical protein